MVVSTGAGMASMALHIVVQTASGSRFASNRRRERAVAIPTRKQEVAREQPRRRPPRQAAHGRRVPRRSRSGFLSDHRIIASGAAADRIMQRFESPEVARTTTSEALSWLVYNVEVVVMLPHTPFGILAVGARPAVQSYDHRGRLHPARAARTAHRPRSDSNASRGVHSLTCNGRKSYWIGSGCSLPVGNRSISTRCRPARSPRSKLS